MDRRKKELSKICGVTAQANQIDNKKVHTKSTSQPDKKGFCLFNFVHVHECTISSNVWYGAEQLISVLWRNFVQHRFCTAISGLFLAKCSEFSFKMSIGHSLLSFSFHFIFCFGHAMFSRNFSTFFSIVYIFDLFSLSNFSLCHLLSLFDLLLLNENTNRKWYITIFFLHKYGIKSVPNFFHSNLLKYKVKINILKVDSIEGKKTTHFPTTPFENV